MFPYSTYLSLRKQRQGSQKEAVQNKGGLCYSSHQEKKKKPSSKQYNNVFICLSLLYSPVVTFASPKEKKQVIVV